jgi:polyhydroxybutyrate depolymerase
VVVVLHGLGVSANAMSRAADWRGAVARDDFLAVFPQGVQDSWNLGPCCGPANVRGIDDLGFLDLLLDELLARPDVDGSRVYLTGFSNGALMVYELACRRPSTFAAVAPMAGANLTGCAPDRPLSLLHQHGDVDLVVPYRGGVAIGSVLTLEAFPSVPDGVAAWAAADGCDPQPVVEAGPDVERTRWVGCAEGVRVELIRIPGVGHVWPRRGAFDPLDVLLAFFDLG